MKKELSATTHLWQWIKLIAVILLVIWLCSCETKLDHIEASDLRERQIDTALLKPIDPHEYQIELTLDSIYIYDHNRHVATIPHGISYGIDSVFAIDNQ